MRERNPPTVIHDSWDRAVYLLLRTHVAVAGVNGAEPLTSLQWVRLSEALTATRTPLAALPGLEQPALLELCDGEEQLAARTGRCLEGYDKLGESLERWQNAGIWTLTPYDPGYPAVLVERLGNQAPPVLFGAGPVDLLTAAGIAIVGSRKLNDEATAFADLAGQRCAEQELVVISGGAAGADVTAMTAALKHGGRVVGILSGNLRRTLREPESRAAVSNGRLLLTTAVLPDTGFDGANAMNRNKYIYALSSAAIVVDARLGEGGTWGGATDALRRADVPVYVRETSPLSPAHQALVAMGAHTVSDETLAEETRGPRSLMVEHGPPTDAPNTAADQEDLPATADGSGPVGAAGEPKKRRGKARTKVSQSALFERPAGYKRGQQQRTLSAQQQLASGRDQLLDLLYGLDGDAITRRPAPGSWNIWEIAYHLFDIERWYIAKLCEAVSADQPAALRQFIGAWAKLRDITLELSAIVPPERLDQPGLLSGVPDWTPRALLQMIADHDNEHGGQISEALAAQIVPAPVEQHMEPIFHIVAIADWQGSRGGSYRGDTLDSEGFIHCSTAQQVAAVATERFRGRGDLLLLSIDPARLAPELRWEGGTPQTGPFPHIYGPLNADAVCGVLSFRPETTGAFHFPLSNTQ